MIKFEKQTIQKNPKQEIIIKRMRINIEIKLNKLEDI